MRVRFRHPSFFIVGTFEDCIRGAQNFVSFFEKIFRQPLCQKLVQKILECPIERHSKLCNSALTSSLYIFTDYKAEAYRTGEEACKGFEETSGTFFIYLLL